jgi:hypothetical protein
LPAPAELPILNKQRAALGDAGSIEEGHGMAVTEVPHAVVKVLDGRPRQQPIGWPRARWLARFPECDAVLAALPDQLDRPTVRAACRDAASSPVAAWQAFVVVMAWGHGTVGYGPWRTARILRDTSDAPERLASVAQQLAERGAVDAYGLLAGDCRLRWLGPAFGTKYLYFCPQPAEPQALILDRLVARWLTQHVGISLQAGPWSPSTYRRYLELLGSWAAALGVAADEVEQAIFQAQADQQRNQWAGTRTIRVGDGSSGRIHSP